jgi:hypothetical protein
VEHVFSPAAAAVYASAYKPEPEAKPDRSAVIYAGQSDDLAKDPPAQRPGVTTRSCSAQVTCSSLIPPIDWHACSPACSCSARAHAAGLFPAVPE